MSQSKNETEITLFDQIKKFAIKSMLGFQTVLVFGLGRRLGIFDYLYKKASSSNSDDISSVSFTLDELSNGLNLDPTIWMGGCIWHSNVGYLNEINPVTNA